MNPNKRKAAPDGGTSKGGNGDKSIFIIGHGIDGVKVILRQLGMRQQLGDVCPRCGSSGVVTHVTSRYADVYICQACLDDEQHELDVGQPHLLLEDWDYIKEVRS